MVWEYRAFHENVTNGLWRRSAGKVCLLAYVKQDVF
jgi:hypothetical protein